MKSKTFLLELIILLFFILSCCCLSAETVILKTTEEMSGNICKLDDHDLFLCEEKSLYIIPINMIEFVWDEQGRQLELIEIRKRKFTKLNYNSFVEIKEIQDLKTRKKFKPRYSSKRYGTYYDRRVNKMIYGNTTRTLDKNLFSFSIYNLILLNYSMGITDNMEIDIFTAPLLSLVESGIAFKYNIFRRDNFDFSIKSGFKHLSDPFYDEGYRDKRYAFPTMFLCSYGNIDYFLTGYFGLDVVKDFGYYKNTYDYPFIYQLAGSVRIFKHVTLYLEFFNSVPLVDGLFYEGTYDFTYASGLRFFWKKNSIDLGIIMYPSSEHQTDDTFMPVINYTHHFYTE